MEKISKDELDKFINNGWILGGTKRNMTKCKSIKERKGIHKNGVNKFKK